MYIADVCNEYGDKELSAGLTSRFSAILHAASGLSYDDEEFENFNDSI